MGQRANKSLLGRHSMGWPGSRVRHSSPRVPDKRGGASQGAQPSRLRSPKRAKAPRSEGAYYPPTKGAKATRSVGAAYLLLWGVPSMWVGWGVVVAGGVVWAKRQWPAPRWRSATPKAMRSTSRAHPRSRNRIYKFILPMNFKSLQCLIWLNS